MTLVVIVPVGLIQVKIVETKVGRVYVIDVFHSTGVQANETVMNFGLEVIIIFHICDYGVIDVEVGV